jgi:hypothetical protein
MILLSISLHTSLQAQSMNLFMKDQNGKFKKTIKLNELKKNKGIKVFSFYDKNCQACFEDLRVVSIAIKRKLEGVEFYGFQIDAEVSMAEADSVVDREGRFKEYLSKISSYGILTETLLPKPILVSKSPFVKHKLLDAFAKEWDIDVEALKQKEYPFHIICDQKQSCNIFNQKADFRITNEYDTIQDFFESTVSNTTSSRQSSNAQASQSTDSQTSLYLAIFVCIIVVLFLALALRNKK